MRRDQRRRITQPPPILSVPTTIWNQLPASSQHQLAGILAQLIQRVRATKSDKGDNDER